ncbi:unnamed protein product [Gadus morhua 'NCC']
MADRDKAHSINPNHFPAKLWCLANHPVSRAVRWDPRGEGLIIHQHLFETHFLTGPQNAPGGGDLFKTTNFSSFIRQLNLYGFRKVESWTTTRGSGGGGGGGGGGDGGGVGGGDVDGVPASPVVDHGLEHHFRHPNFRQGRPELLVNLRRLTSSNKAKLEAGLEVKCRPPGRYHQSWTGNIEDKVERRGGSVLGQKPPAPACPYTPSRPTPPIKEYSRTPVPSRGWMMADGSRPCIPISVLHHYPGESSGSAAVHIQQGAHGPANPGQRFYNLISHAPQYRPTFYSSAYDFHVPSPVSSDLTGGGNQLSPYPHLSYYQPNVPVGLLYPGNHYQDLQSVESQDLKKNDLNLDTVFQIIDEYPSTQNVCMVKVVTPEKPGRSSGPPINSHCSPLPTSSQAWASSTLVEDKTPVACSPIIISVQGNSDRGTGSYDMKPIKEEMMEEAIFKAPLSIHNHALVKVSRDKVAKAKASSALNDSALP